ncbi:MAG: hypothetical protein ACE5LU_05275 [Anaerolineae bacterium]
MQRRTIAPLALGPVFLGLGVLLFVIGWLLGISRPPEGPRLVFVQEVADYGDVPIEEMVTHYFEFSNQGDQPLFIDGEPEVETIAGC